MKTITLQIGNSDDRLGQAEWAAYVKDVRDLLTLHGVTIHFFGAPSNWEPWQNACWVFNGEEREILAIRAAISSLRANYQQQAVAWTEGATEFL